MINISLHLQSIKRIALFLFNQKISKATDEELIHEFLHSGNRKYYGEICDRYIPLVYGLCLKYLRNEALAQDAVMQIFENVQQHQSLPSIKSFRPWIYQVSKNFCLQHLRQKNMETVSDFDPEFVESLENAMQPHNDDLNGIRLDALRDSLEQLSPPQQTCIRLFFMEEKSYEEITKITGYSLNNVKSHIQNGKRNLKISIEKSMEE